MQHNNGESQYTSGKLTWVMLFLLVFESKKEALLKEKIECQEKLVHDCDHGGMIDDEVEEELKKIIL